MAWRREDGIVRPDLLIVGGGLAGGLLALRLAETRPELDWRLVEAAPRLGGNHTWSFHQPDLTASQHAWIDPLVAHRWPGYEVRFPQRQRRLGSGYASISAERFHEVLNARLPAERLLLGRKVLRLQDDGIVFTDGYTLAAGAVIDARGPRPDPALWLGYQKFLGQEVRLASPHGLTEPIVMDATVDQLDGYRFVYTLPLASDRLLIEDTYYADGESLPVERLRQHLADYAHQRGWTIAEVLREEQGILPITLGGDVDSYWDHVTAGAPIGLAAGLFHPTTGYSLPEAVRLAEHLAAQPFSSSAALRETLRHYAQGRWQRQGFFRLLNRMLFLAGRPEHRVRVMQRFYGLGEPLIQRFYAGRLTAFDRLRILSGKPPVPLKPALDAALARPPQFKEAT
ncbi:lycopene beta-cyclase CrtY [Pseudomonas oryzihabitans]|uniref:lycopene beta-cyclase CrtY n=1 Tax=Pseudomonas oryzihabitans TaxID=47885 RepID=UPI002894F331|nr:lycopene beta-cyclase CrtY [Pseudomonas oryzihabitans]MDT3721551.1 lycopene beta-cyclase CrtY [Pseudomonas oryzihabitans]